MRCDIHDRYCGRGACFVENDAERGEPVKRVPVAMFNRVYFFVSVSLGG